MSKRKYSTHSEDEIIDLTNEIKKEKETEHLFSKTYLPIYTQNPISYTNQYKDERPQSSDDPLPSDPPTSFSPAYCAHDNPPPVSPNQPGSRGKRRAWTKEEDHALLDSIIVELSGHWSSICSRNELLIQRGPSMASQRFKSSIKHKLLGGENSKRPRVKDDEE
ncbi:6265_t:CDS:2 [Funneliformis geosporum]|uniref:13652_t:CDS:1 n=1 Tax=Funneliformis geosporum TaxID=1117311 RepID=A0A9W4WY13_9GLOM|nr:6265_t:CDS:2 [Funneliformis geosporum]CAI2187627.1 13652_t:CDS:2 [Funneliformis geosporum]